MSKRLTGRGWRNEHGVMVVHKWTTYRTIAGYNWYWELFYVTECNVTSNVAGYVTNDMNIQESAAWNVCDSAEFFRLVWCNMYKRTKNFFIKTLCNMRIIYPTVNIGNSFLRQKKSCRLSVRPSVSPAVPLSNAWIVNLWQNERKFDPYSYTAWKIINPKFSDK